MAVWCATAFSALLPAASYYALPFSERAFSPDHATFAPTGLVGHSYGIAGALLMTVGVSTYSLRKRWRALSNAGKLRYWLEFHIFCCTLGPFLVLLHTSFKFGGIVAISFFSMALVVASGVFGRYVYVRIPKTVNGRFHTLDEIRMQRDQIAGAIGERLGAHRQHVMTLVTPNVSAAARGALPASLWSSFRAERQARGRMRHVNRELLRSGVAPANISALSGLLQQQARLERELVLLQPFQQLFRYWHVFHLPFAIIMFVVLALHIGVAIAFGYGWPQ